MGKRQSSEKVLYPASPGLPRGSNPQACVQQESIESGAPASRIASVGWQYLAGCIIGRDKFGGGKRYVR
jgi:hypothetical protein